MLDSLGLLLIIVFCKKLVYTSKDNTNHFSTFKMVHIMVFSFGVSLVQLVDGLKTLLNNLFWKNYIIGDTRKPYMLLKIHVVS